MSIRSETQPRAASSRALPALPIERYRGIAAVLLIGMLLIAAFAPLSTPPPLPQALVLPPFDGQPAKSLADTLFNYPAERERQATPVSNASALRLPTSGTDFLQAMAGQMLIEEQDPDTTQGAQQPHLVSEQVQPGGPDRWNSLETFYLSTQDGWAANGLSIVELLRAGISQGSERDLHLSKALYWVDTAVQIGPLSGPYNYNWALIHFILGNYQQAATGMQEVLDSPGNDPNNGGGLDLDAARFYKGLALLRLGEPQDALTYWQTARGNVATPWASAFDEAIADAQAAIGNVPGALDAYGKLQDQNTDLDWGLYEKQIRLALGQAGAEQALGITSALSARYPNEARLHYDMGRLLVFLGRLGSAAGAFRAALAIQNTDPAYHAGLAEALLATRDAQGAVAESEAAIRGVGLDPNAADLTLTYGKIGSSSFYQRSVGQAILDANVVRAQALAQEGQQAQVRTLAAGVEQQGAGGDAAKAAWFRYYAGLLYAAGGMQADALTRFKPATPQPGPGAGPLLLAWERTLTPAQARDQAGDILTGAGGQGNGPPFPADAAMAAGFAELAAKLEQAGAAHDAGPLYRAAALWEGAQDNSGAQAVLAANGTARPTQFRLAEADYLRRQGDPAALTVTRYQQVLAVAPALAAAHTNRGVAYYQAGDHLRAQREFELALRVDPASTLAAHNLGALALDQGPAGLGQALNTLITTRIPAGASALGSSETIVPAPDIAAAPAPVDAGFGTRLPALLTLLFLLIHTLIPAPRPADALAAGAHPAPQGSLLSRWGELLAARWMLGGGAGRMAALAVLAAAVIGGLGWGWALSSNTPLLALALAPLTILAALLALGAQEAVQWWAVRRERQAGQVQTRVWPLGLLLSLVGAPFGLLYGWLVTTAAHADPAAAGARRDGADDETDVLLTVATPAAATPATATRPRAARAPATRPAAPARKETASTEERLAWRGWAALGPAARVALAGLLANVVLAVIFAAGYIWLGTSLWRILLLGSLAVLAFTASSDRLADGWSLWRRSPLLWLILFAAAAALLAVLLLGAW